MDPTTTTENPQHHQENLMKDEPKEIATSSVAVNPFQDAIVSYYSHLMSQVQTNLLQLEFLRALQVGQQGSLQSPAPPPPVQQIEQPAYDIENVISDEAGINTQENAIIRGDRFCSNCFVVKTPLWRRDPKSGGHLCNACGLYQRNNSGSARPLERPKNTRVTSSKHKGKKCYNCQAEKTTLWRQITNEKITVCNACGLYYNLHNAQRPAHLIKKNCIQTRNRKNKKSSVMPSVEDEETGQVNLSSNTDTTANNNIIQF